MWCYSKGHTIGYVGSEKRTRFSGGREKVRTAQGPDGGGGVGDAGVWR